MSVLTFCGEEPHLLLWPGAGATRENIPVSSISDWTPELFCNFYSICIIYSHSVWPRHIRRVSTGTCALGSRVRILPGA